MPRVYTELRPLARAHLSRRGSQESRQPTALINELFLRLIDRQRVDRHEVGRLFRWLRIEETYVLLGVSTVTASRSCCRAR